MRRLTTLTVVAVFLAGGVSLAMICRGGSSARGNAAYEQYHGKPECDRHKRQGHHGHSSGNQRDSRCPTHSHGAHRHGRRGHHDRDRNEDHRENGSRQGRR
jgi:hypothetical protein